MKKLREMRDELQKEAEKKRPMHEAEYLLNQAEKAIDSLIPGGVRLITMGGKNLCIEDLGGAMMGMLLMSDPNERQLTELIEASMELTCQAVISRKMEEK